MTPIEGIFYGFGIAACVFILVYGLYSLVSWVLEVGGLRLEMKLLQERIDRHGNTLGKYLQNLASHADKISRLEKYKNTTRKFPVHSESETPMLDAAENQAKLDQYYNDRRTAELKIKARRK